MPAEGEYFRPGDDFFDADLRLELLDFRPVEPFFELLLLRALVLFEVDLRALLFFALVFFALVFLAVLFLVADDFLALLLLDGDLFLLLELFRAAFFVAMTILPWTQMFPPFETVVWLSGNPRRKRPSARNKKCGLPHVMEARIG